INYLLRKMQRGNATSGTIRGRRAKWIETYAALGASLLVGIGERLGRPGLQVGAMVRQIILAGFVVFLPAGVQAQGRGRYRGGGWCGRGQQFRQRGTRAGRSPREGASRTRIIVLDQIAARRRDWDSTRYTKRRSADLEPRACGEAGFRYRFSSRFLTAGFHCRVLRWL